MKINLLLIAFILMARTLSAAEPKTGRWAACAFSRHMQWAGNSISESSEYMAKKAALRGCASNDCEIHAYVERGCIAIASCFDPRTGTWHGFGASKFIPIEGDLSQHLKLLRFQAQETAREACMTAAHAAHATVLNSYCTWEYDEPFSVEAVRKWIESMGGEGSRDVRSVLDFINWAAEVYVLRVGVTLEHAACLSLERRWRTVEEFATKCEFTAPELKRLWAEAVKY